MNINIHIIEDSMEETLDIFCHEANKERLQEIAGQSNRRVGIISHRKELEEPVPVQIRVVRKGEGRSQVEIKNQY